ncbi:hypothetical protein MKK67_06655, partial [Methylobacterium sp. J-072]|uniref:hypothetical protein n=1 Tax=Methylobacterium sp. J-072 TaxID=2836651 RepID=UPI001FBB11BA
MKNTYGSRAPRIKRGGRSPAAATPALHTTEIFGEPIFTYSYRDAVIDGHLNDHEPPVRIETALARYG